MKTKRTINIILIAAAILLISGGALHIYFDFFNKKTPAKTNLINEIPEYEYKSYDRDSTLYLNKFDELKELLNEEDYDEEKYISLISELFIIDFYTLANKFTNQDVGGVQYLHTDVKDNLVLKAKDTMYKYIENKLYEKRDQELPTVSETTTKEITKEQNAYEVKIEITYEKDLGYDEERTLVLSKEDFKYAITEIN